MEFLLDNKNQVKARLVTSWYNNKLNSVIQDISLAIRIYYRKIKQQRIRYFGVDPILRGWVLVIPT